MKVQLFIMVMTMFSTKSISLIWANRKKALPTIFLVLLTGKRTQIVISLSNHPVSILYYLVLQQERSSNVVPVDSCSFEVLLFLLMSNKVSPYVAGIISHFNSSKGVCILENNVNMASIAFNWNNSVIHGWTNCWFSSSFRVYDSNYKLY